MEPLGRVLRWMSFILPVPGTKQVQELQDRSRTFRGITQPHTAPGGSIGHSRPPLEPKGVLKGLRNSGKEIQEKTVFHDFSLFSGVFDPQDPHRKIELINAHLSVGVSTL